MGASTSNPRPEARPSRSISPPLSRSCTSNRTLAWSAIPRKGTARPKRDVILAGQAALRSPPEIQHEEDLMPRIARNGIEIDYTDSGGSGAPVLLIHAFPLSGAMWEPQIESLGERFRLIAPSLRGFGSSSVP